MEDLRLQCSTQSDKLKSGNKQMISLENQLQTTRIQFERQQKLSDRLQAEIDAQTCNFNAVRRDLAEEQRRVDSREHDIRSLEQSLEQLKD